MCSNKNRGTYLEIKNDSTQFLQVDAEIVPEKFNNDLSFTVPSAYSFVIIP
jgi:hypothetical protein